MYVLLIIEGTYPWYRGGVSEWVYQYLCHLPEMHFTVLQIATDEFQGLDPSKALYPLAGNVRQFIRIPPPDIKDEWQQYLEGWYQEHARQVLPLAVGHDVLHVTNTGFAGWLGVRMAKQFDLPLMLTEHALYWKEVEMGAVALECGYKIPENAGAKMKISESFKEIASLTYSNAQQIVTVSKYNIASQKKLGAAQVHYIPNGIPENWLLEEKQRGEQPVIGWVGRCAEMKNPLAFFNLAQAFRTLNSNPGFTMLLSDANEKSLEKEIRRKAENYPEVEVVWNQPAKNYFRDFDFLMITSHNESQPLVMLEALAHKALPAGYSVGDLTGDYGLVFETSTSLQAIAKEMLNLWDNPEKFEAYILERFVRVKEQHTWERIFGSYKKLLMELAEAEQSIE